MKKYKAIIFDLFGTLVHFDETRLPLLKLNEEEIYCTTGFLFEIASRVQNGYTLETFYEGLDEISTLLHLEKSASLKEISCLTRMKTLLIHLNFPENEETDRLADLMKNIHMGWMRKCIHFPETHLLLLKKLKKEFRLGLLSNFDDADTGYRILSDLQIDLFFHSILFSEETGWIKPNRHLFEKIVSRMNIHPEEALFVGDTPNADVVGPKQIGMDTVWINPFGHPFPEQSLAPDFEIKQLPELELIIQR